MTLAGLRADKGRRVRVGDGHFNHAINGRFKGGCITRHYGRPETEVEAVQLELAQYTYMDEDSFEYMPGRAAPVQEVIRVLLETCLGYAAD